MYYVQMCLFNECQLMGFFFRLQNLLNNFSQSDVMTAVARVFLLFQMLTVFPLLAYILRSQILYAVFNSVYPSFLHVIIMNVLLLTVNILVAIFLPEVGTITR